MKGLSAAASPLLYGCMEVTLPEVDEGQLTAGICPVRADDLFETNSRGLQGKNDEPHRKNIQIPQNRMVYRLSTTSENVQNANANVPI